MVDSSTGGYLVPTSAPPVSDDDLEDVIHDLVVGVTGLSGDLVRPRYQTTMPKHPEPNVNWCAVGTVELPYESNPSDVHSGDGDGSSEQQSHQGVRVVASMYGPRAGHYASLLFSGLYVPQNREEMWRVAGLRLGNVGSPLRAPTLVNNNWINRYDMEIRLRRQIDRTYAVRSLIQADLSVSTLLSNDDTSTTSTVTPEVYYLVDSDGAQLTEDGALLFEVDSPPGYSTTEYTLVDSDVVPLSENGDTLYEVAV